MCKKHHVTAIIFDKRGRPLSIGQNSYIKTHPLQLKMAEKVGLPEKKFIHAEIQSIVKMQGHFKSTQDCDYAL